MNLVTITPRPKDDGPTLTQGTTVHLSDGTKLEGVTRIELLVEPNSVWKARIDILIAPQQVEGVLAQIAVNTFDPEGQVVEITNLEDESVRVAGRPQ